MSKITHIRGAFSGSPRAFIATPTYTGKVDASYFSSLLKSLPLLEAAGIGYDSYLLSYNCHVDDSRNGILRDFLETDCTDLVFIDADVSWEPEDLVKLVKYDRDIVAGVYPKRSDKDLEFPVRVESGISLYSDKDGLVEVAGAPTGFMKIKRHVIEKFFEANKHRRFTGAGQGPESRPYTIVFERTYESGHRFSGDYAFCKQWQKMGGKVFVDPEMRLSHLGEVEFSGTLGDFWKEKHGVAQDTRERDFCQALTDLKSGDASDEVFFKLSKTWGNPNAAEVDALIACYELAKQSAGPILEAGSGLTTLIMAIANPSVQVHCLEHDPIWGSHTQYLLDIHGIKNVTIHFERLKEYESGRWYDTATLPKDPFSFVLCDGPPRKISNRNILYKTLSEQIKGAVVLMDDADNDTATKGIRDWAKDLGREVKVLGGNRHFAVSPLGATL
jgi:hypothetical protein